VVDPSSGRHTTYRRTGPRFTFTTRKSTQRTPPTVYHPPLPGLVARRVWLFGRITVAYGRRFVPPPTTPRTTRRAYPTGPLTYSFRQAFFRDVVGPNPTALATGLHAFGRADRGACTGPPLTLPTGPFPVRPTYLPDKQDDV